MKKHWQSFLHACHGLLWLVKHELNFRIELLCAIVTVSAGLFTGLSKIEWIAIIALIALVLIMEAFNTAIEKIMDMIHPVWDKRVKVIKDISAGAVLLAVIAAVAVGMFIFIPKWFSL